MKKIGLVKWFDSNKGFGMIGVPQEKDIFCHINNFKVRPTKISTGKPLVFDFSEGKKGPFANNIYEPSSFEDFQLGLNYIEQDPDIHILETVTGTSRWGNKYRKKETFKYNLLESFLTQCCKLNNASSIYSYFRDYFSEVHAKQDPKYALRFFQLTETVISNSDIDLSDELLEEYREKRQKLIDEQQEKSRNSNSSIPPIYLSHHYKQDEFLIQKLFLHYLYHASPDLLFIVWAERVHIIGNKYGHNPTGEISFKFPPEAFLQNYDKLASYTLERFVEEADDLDLVIKVLKKKISCTNPLLNNDTERLIKVIQSLKEPGLVSPLGALLVQTLLKEFLDKELLTYSSEIGDEFKKLLHIIKSFSEEVFYKQAVDEFNSHLINDVKFGLWHYTSYFEPSIEFLDRNFEKFDYSDFCKAPASFHEKNFNNELRSINDINTSSGFFDITFLIITIPIKAIQYIINDLNQFLKAAYWLRFPQQKRDYDSRKYYEADYEKDDIDNNTSSFLKLIETEENLLDIIIPYNIVSKIQIAYYGSFSGYSGNDKYPRILPEAREKIKADAISASSSSSLNDSINILKSALEKTDNNERRLVVDAMIPRFVNLGNASEKEINAVLKISELSKDDKTRVYRSLFESASGIDQIRQWLKGNLDEISIKDYFEVFHEFTHSEQRILLRKLFGMIHKSCFDFDKDIEDGFMKLSQDKSIDMDTRICLSVINSLLNSNEYLNEKAISEIISSSAEENFLAIIQIDKFFQKCKGRTWITNAEEQKPEWYLEVLGKEYPVFDDRVIIGGRHYPFNKENRTLTVDGENLSFRWRRKVKKYFSKQYDIPKGMVFCDARQSQVDEISKLQFYWCCNQKCFDPMQFDHSYIEWRNYSLRDFMKILGLQFDEDLYYRFVNILNRANRLLKKLQCDSCKKLLRDVSSSEFAFYRVTRFHCTNKDCSEYLKVIYLNHCLNWRCNNIVDSRISNTCPNGWYICDQCDNCCSQRVLENRLANLHTNKAFNPNNPRHQHLQMLVEQKLGHMERGEKFDYKSGLPKTE